MNTLDAIELMHEEHGKVQASRKNAAWQFVAWTFWIAIAVMVLGTAVT